MCFLIVADCLPSLTPNGSPVYVVDKAASYDLSWNYNTDGATIKEVELLYAQGNDDIYVAQKIESPNPPALVINPASGYTNRITFSIGSGSRGRVTFRISKIVQSDSRTFKCQISFTNFNRAPVQNSIDLVVVGKYPQASFQKMHISPVYYVMSRTRQCIFMSRSDVSYW